MKGGKGGRDWMTSKQTVSKLGKSCILHLNGLNEGWSRLRSHLHRNAQPLEKLTKLRLLQGHLLPLGSLRSPRVFDHRSHWSGGSHLGNRDFTSILIYLACTVLDFRLILLIAGCPIEKRPLGPVAEIFRRAWV